MIENRSVFFFIITTRTSFARVTRDSNSHPLLFGGQNTFHPSVIQEEQVLAEYALRMADNGYPLPVKFLRSLALIIVRQRSSIFQIPAPDPEARPPGKNWPQGFYKRHPELKSRRLKAIDWKRDGRQIEEKVQQRKSNSGLPSLAESWPIPPFSRRMFIIWTRRESSSAFSIP
jgi:hypothetical protein